jgi:hypothetical protein
MKLRILLSILLVALFVAFVGCGGTSNPVDPQDNGGRTVEWYNTPPVVWPLMAGQSIQVGTITVTNDLSYLHVTYQITVPDWYLTTTHVAVATSLDGIPHNKQGIPVPGQFPYKTDHNPPVTSFQYDIPLGWVEGTELYIATHAEVEKIVQGVVRQSETGWAGDHKFPCKRWAYYFHWTVQGCYINLPETQVGVTMYYPGTESYWSHVLSNVPSGYDVADGTYLAWCLQKYVYAYPNYLYQTTLYASTDPNLPDCFPGVDWGRINWILNHKNGAGVQDIQDSVWYFTGAAGYPTTPGAIALVEDALANGEGFEPGPGEIMAAIVYIGCNVQSTFIEVVCGC